MAPLERGVDDGGDEAGVPRPLVLRPVNLARQHVVTERQARHDPRIRMLDLQRYISLQLMLQINLVIIAINAINFFSRLTRLKI